MLSFTRPSLKDPARMITTGMTVLSAQSCQVHYQTLSPHTALKITAFQSQQVGKATQQNLV